MKKIIATIALNSRPMFMAQSPDGARLYVSSVNDGTVTVIDTASKKVVHTTPVGVITGGMALSPDGTKLYIVAWRTGGPGVDVRVMNTATAAWSVVMPIDDQWPLGLAVHPDGTRLYVACNDTDSVKVVDLATATVTATIAVASPQYWLTWRPNSSDLVCNSWATHRAAVVDTVTNRVTSRLPVSDTPWVVAVEPNGARAYVGTGQQNSATGALEIVDLIGKQFLGRIPLAGLPLGAAFNQDGSRLYVSNGSVLTEINTTTNTPVQTVTMGGRTAGVVVSPDQKRIYVAQEELRRIAVIEERPAPSIADMLAKVRGWLQIVLPLPDGFRKPPRPTIDERPVFPVGPKASVRAGTNE